MISFLLCSVQSPSECLLLPSLGEGSGVGRATWNFTLQRKGMTLTGICLVRRTEQGVVGSVVNEFGVHYFDFTCKSSHVKLSNVFPAMDKWYIRRVLRRDLLLLTADHPVPTGRRRQLDLHLPDSLSLHNTKYDITYKFESLTIDH